ncbi:MAG: alpha-galactosidase [Anaerolineales bacterium]|nr:alpha-galactosidase [Anaerolineales bacterium]
MTLILKTSHLQLTINPAAATWSLFSSQQDGPYLDGVSQRVRYRRKHKKFSALMKWPNREIHPIEQVSSPHGNLQQLRLEIGPDKNGLRYTLTFALPEQHPLMLWKVEISNQGVKPVHIRQIEMLSAGFFPKKRRLPQAGPIVLSTSMPPSDRGAIRPHPDPGELAFFSNGWQSWSHTGVFGAREYYQRTRLGFLTAPMWHNPGTPRPEKAGHFASDMFGVLGDRQRRTGILAGFLSQKQHFGSLLARINEPFYPALRLWANGDQAQLDPGAAMTTDWAVIQFVDIDASEPLAPYLEAVARELSIVNSQLRIDNSPTGWCSWYHFFQDIDEGKIRANLQAASELRTPPKSGGMGGVSLDLIQIDDGFEAQIGDWFEFDPGFPEGVAPLAREIREAGFTPGLWLAPFIVHSKSRLAKNHPDWLLRNRWGLPVNAGFVWKNFNKALDLTHPEALEYACDVVRAAAHEWGYSYLKLDFLYAAALNGRFRDRTKTRAQVLRMGLEALREAVGPEVALLGCGAPLGPSIGIFDAMRIGADVAPRWMPKEMGFEAPVRDETPLPSTRNALGNTLTRAPLHRRWWINDPDCLLIRPDSDLSLAEVQSLATAIALTGGAMLLSDDLPKLPPERLRIAEQLLPLIGKTPRVLDWFDAPMPRLLRLDLENSTGPWHLLAVFNWADKVQDVRLTLEKFDLDPDAAYLSRSFWEGASGCVSGGSLDLSAIPPHGVRLLALRPTPPVSPPRAGGTEGGVYLGSNLHISQGLEVTQWSTSTPGGVRLQLERPGKSQGEIELYLPRVPQRATLNQKEITWRTTSVDCYSFPVSFDQIAKLEIK